jgi:hypothetical protein
LFRGHVTGRAQDLPRGYQAGVALDLFGQTEIRDVRLIGFVDKNIGRLELGWEEVARRLGRTEGAVRKLWARALRQLRPLLDERL